MTVIFMWPGEQAMRPWTKKIWHILTWQNLIRKRKEYIGTISTIDAYRAMKYGRNEYRRYIRKRERRI